MGLKGEIYVSETRVRWRDLLEGEGEQSAAVVRGRMRFEALAVRKVEMSTGKVEVMDYVAEPSVVRGAKAIDEGRLHVGEKGLMASVRGMLKGTDGRGAYGVRVMAWIERGWVVMDVPRDLGLPAGRRDDGRPVWVVSPVIVTKPVKAAEFVEVEEDGKILRSTLPVKAVLTQAEHEVTYVQGKPVVMLNGKWGNDFMVGMIFRNGKGEWEWVGSGREPGYLRPAHGGHDYIGRKSWVMGSDRVLVLWQNPMPVHGPLVVFGAHGPREMLRVK